MNTSMRAELRDLVGDAYFMGLIVATLLVGIPFMLLGMVVYSVLIPFEAVKIVWHHLLKPKGGPLVPI